MSYAFCVGLKNFLIKSNIEPVKLTKENFKALASAAEVEVWMEDFGVYLTRLEDVFGNDAGHSSDLRFDPASMDAGALFDAANPEDLGVSQFAKHTTPELLKILGKHSLPYTCLKIHGRKLHPLLGWSEPRAPTHATYRPDDAARLRDAGYTRPTPSIFPETPPAHSKNDLQWHQLVAIAAIHKQAWAPTSAPQCNGVLLADDVGVGKTMSAFGSVAFMVDIVDRLSAGHADKLPPLLGKLCLYSPLCWLISY